ncbi:unnamed protein product [Fusarium graminearum]|uniref:Uncharacterized protein n=1 Tax=Gibberella zeae TaxID=5518 RepID=A0A4E9ECD9_GIBZA|nr:unnamed protein product [Fusarium graminearum]CAG1962585.1 unnamed protein product [Fusarium graminearum]
MASFFQPGLQGPVLEDCKGSSGFQVYCNSILPSASRFGNFISLFTYIQLHFSSTAISNNDEKGLILPIKKGARLSIFHNGDASTFTRTLICVSNDPNNSSILPLSLAVLSSIIPEATELLSHSDVLLNPGSIWGECSAVDGRSNFWDYGNGNIPLLSLGCFLLTSEPTRENFDTVVRTQAHLKELGMLQVLEGPDEQRLLESLKCLISRKVGKSPITSIVQELVHGRLPSLENLYRLHELTRYLVDEAFLLGEKRILRQLMQTLQSSFGTFKSQQGDLSVDINADLFSLIVFTVLRRAAFEDLYMETTDRCPLFLS